MGLQETYLFISFTLLEIFQEFVGDSRLATGIDKIAANAGCFRVPPHLRSLSQAVSLFNIAGTIRRNANSRCHFIPILSNSKYL